MIKPSMPTDPAEVQRFLGLIDKNGPRHPVLKTRCWIWMAYRNDTGYGRFLIRGVGQRSAHRIMWELTFGPAGNKWVLHHCDIRACCNPAHMWLGDHADNMADMVKKGRARSGIEGPGDVGAAPVYPRVGNRGDRHVSKTHPEKLPRGERNGTSKLTDDAVRNIRFMCGAGARVQELADLYGVHRGTVYAVKNGHRWRHVR